MVARIDQAHCSSISEGDYKYKMNKFLGPDRGVLTSMGKFKDWGKYKLKDTVNIVNRLNNTARK